MAIIRAEGLTKTYRVAQKPPGFLASVRHLVKRTYRDVQAAVDVSFSIEPGEIVGFLGENGAGKTTTLKMLTGLVHPTSGSCEVSGCVPFKRERSFLRDITLVIGGKQQLIWDLPTLDTLRINAAVYEIDDDEAQRRIDELAEMLDIHKVLTTPVRKLSLGQRMKAELLASLLHQPQVLFLDEPTLGLDVNAQATIRAFLKHYNEEHNATILLTSHYMADITALAERVLLMHEGKLIFDGGLRSLLDKMSPGRVVEIQLSADVDDKALQRFGELTKREGRSVELRVSREGMPGRVAEMLGALPVADLSVRDEPIEQLIGRVFTEGVA